MALEEIRTANAPGRVPIVVGGTGLYLRALMEGLADIPPVPADIRASVTRSPRRHRQPRPSCAAGGARSGNGGPPEAGRHPAPAARCRGAGSHRPLDHRMAVRPGSRPAARAAVPAHRGRSPARSPVRGLRRALRQDDRAWRAGGSAGADGARSAARPARHEGARRARAFIIFARAKSTCRRRRHPPGNRPAGTPSGKVRGSATSLPRCMAAMSFPRNIRKASNLPFAT